MLTLLVRQQAIGRLLLRPGRKDHRKRLAEMPQPRPAHAHNPVPNPAIGMGAAAILPAGPIRVCVQVQGRSRADRPLRRPAQRFAPAGRQRLHPDASSYPRRLAGAIRPPSLGALRTAAPPRCPITTTGIAGADIGEGHQRPHRVRRLPVFGQPIGCHSQHPGSETVHPHPRKNQEPVITDHPRQVGGPRIRRPADEGIARLLVPARRRKPDAAEAAMRRRPDPIPQLTARSPRPALRMMRRHHRLRRGRSAGCPAPLRTDPSVRANALGSCLGCGRHETADPAMGEGS